MTGWRFAQVKRFRKQARRWFDTARLRSLLRSIDKSAVVQINCESGRPMWAVMFTKHDERYGACFDPELYDVRDVAIMMSAHFGFPELA